MQGEATRITLLVTQTLEQIGISYAVGGSLASSLHGVMRSTLDVDIVADMRLEHIPTVGQFIEEVLTGLLNYSGETVASLKAKEAIQCGR